MRKVLQWAPEIVLVLGSTAAGIRAWGEWIDPVGDIGTWWSAIDRLANGELLYRDVYLQFGPLSPYLLAFGAKVFGASTAYLAISCWACAIGASVLLLRASRPFLTTLERLVVVGVLFAIVLFPAGGRLVFPYAPGAVHALLFSLGALLLMGTEGPTGTGRTLVAGVLAGLAFCAKQEIGLACLAALVGPVFLGWRKWSGRVLGGLAGFSVPVALGAGLALGSATLESLRQNSRLWPIAPEPPESWLRLYRLVAGLSVPDWSAVVLESSWRLLLYVALFAVAALLIARERTPARWIPVAVLLVVLFGWWAWRGLRWTTEFHPIALSMLVAFGTAAAVLLLPSLPQRSFLFSLGLFAGLLGVRTAVSTQVAGPYSGVAHFASSLTWVVALCVIAPRLLLDQTKAAAVMRRIVGISLLAFSWTAAFGAMGSLLADGKERVPTRRGNVFVDRNLAPFFRILSRNLAPGERVWVLPEVNGVDALFGARNVSPYPSQMPGWLDSRCEEDLLSRIERNPPDAVVVFRRETREYGVGPFGEGYDRRIARWIEERYAPVATTRGGTLFRRRRGAAASP